MKFGTLVQHAFGLKDPAVTFSIFVGAEREENLIKIDPDKSEFTIERIYIQQVSVGHYVLVYSGNPVTSQWKNRMDSLVKAENSSAVLVVAS